MKKVTGSLVVILMLSLCIMVSALCVSDMVSASEKIKPAFDAPTAYANGLVLVNKIGNSDMVGKEEAAKNIEAILFDLLQKNRKK